MPSERVQRRIDALLDEADDAISRRDWQAARELADAALGFDPDNDEAAGFLRAAERALGSPDVTVTPQTDDSPRADAPSPADAANEQTSFANDRYQVSKFLGEGGKKRVYQAHDTLLDREVAFAVIKTEGFDQTSKERISREAQAMGRLGVHPNIVAVLDLGQEDDGSPYMVTELMGGGDVEALLEDSVGAYCHTPDGSSSEEPSPSPQPSPAEGRGGKSGGLSLDRTIEIGKAVCEGLEFAHARGVVHRDLKPGNVWLTEDGIAKIGDFGLAVMTDRSRLTREGMMVGTVSYMPPEQATGGEITPKADLYSLGAMLYEMVTGRPPFLGDDEIAIIGQHINTPPVAPTWHNGTCPRPLEALIMRMLSKDPSERPESAQDVFNALDTIDLTARGETVERENTSLDSLAGGVFVGRQAEMDQLKGALEDVLGGSGRLVTLMGEPGIGKTRTSEELTTYAGLRGAQTLWGRCYETGGQPPYWPWVQAIRSYVRETDPDELRRQMGSSASVVAEIVTDVKDRLPEIQPPPVIDDPDSARFRLFDSIASFLKSASQAQPLVIVLDDLHWSDKPSLQFLEFMARELSQSRVLLLCTYRDMELNRRHPLTVTLGGLSRERLYERVLLRGLSEGDVARFIEIAAGIQPPPQLTATVHRHTEGNPLFVTEVVRELVQSGDLSNADITGNSTWSVRIPEGVREVIGRRLDRLSERANEILTIAAVVGRDFTLEVLRELGEDTTENQLLDVLDETLDARLIEELSDAVGHYQFTHALMQETLTGELSLTRRVRIHARIAVTLEQLYGGDAEDHAAELVVHFAEAETVLGTEQLVRYLIAAGEAEIEAFAYDDALTYFERAKISAGSERIESDTTLDALIHAGLGRARAPVAEFAQRQVAWDDLSRAYRIYVEKGDVANAVRMASNPIVLGGIVGSTELTREALDLVPEDSVEAGWLWTRHGTCLMDNRGDFEAADAAFERALSIARSTGNKAVEARAHAHMCQIAFHRMDSEEARRQGDMAWALAEEGGDPPSALRSQVFCAAGYFHDGLIEPAFEVLDRNISLAKAVGDVGWGPGSSHFASSLAVCVGDWERALNYQLNYGFQNAGVTNGFPIRYLYDVMNGNIRVDDSAVSKDFLAERGRAPGIGRNRRNYYEDAIGLMLATLGDWPDFFREISKQEIGDLSENHRSWKVSERMMQGVALVALNDSSACAEVYESLKGVHRVFDALAMMSLERVRAQLKTATGETDTAEGHFRTAVEQTREIGAWGELAWTLLHYTEMLLDRDEPGDREKAIELQDEALAITQELGMRPLTERILARREILRA